MKYLKEYLSRLSENECLAKTINETALKIQTEIVNSFDYKSNLTGLLIGHVQSGKTAQSFGVISMMADMSFDILIYLTTDNVILQQQTFNRAKESLPSFDVYSEDDDVSFFKNNLENPSIIVLKKNTSVLRRWRGFLSSSNYCKGRPIVIIDDEADAASLNTQVNKESQSKINKHLVSIRNLFSSSIYLQVTATPQSVLLQSKISGFKPSFIHFFEPGEEYIGGNFIYSIPKSYATIITPENELDEIKNRDSFIPEGLKNSLITFLITCADFYAQDQSCCNFLIHPSVKISDHDTFAESIGECLNLLIFAIRDGDDNDIEEIKKVIEEAWLDLQKTKPNITNKDDIISIITHLLSEERINIIILNSKSRVEDIHYHYGYNIIVGGNSLGRGITIPSLQTVYYCRRSKSPQADTYWQHCRVFGYDRDRTLVRLFLPQSLLNLFKDINLSNEILIKQIIKNGLENTQLIFPPHIKPTRKNVIDRNKLNLIIGGTNYFPNNPIQSNALILDEFLRDIHEEIISEITYSMLYKILQFIDSDGISDWNNKKFIGCVQALETKRPQIKCKLIIRRDRNLSKNTGTMLSPNDRSLGDKNSNCIVLTLYRINGEKEKGWNDTPFWIPNIKFPNNFNFYDIIE